jgi:CspA family cold shock protein
MAERRTTAIVREWYEDEGWGVLDSPQTPGGCFAHFSNIEMPGYRVLSPGERVVLTWEAPGFQQDGYDFRAVKIIRVPA